MSRQKLLFIAACLEIEGIGKRFFSEIFFMKPSNVNDGRSGPTAEEKSAHRFFFLQNSQARYMRDDAVEVSSDAC